MKYMIQLKMLYLRVFFFFFCEEILWPKQPLWNKAFSWGLLIVSEFSPLSAWQKTWWHIGRHGAGVVYESYILTCRSQEKRNTGLDLGFWNPKAHLHWQGHDYSNKTTSPNPSQVVLFPDGSEFKYMTHSYSTHHTIKLKEGDYWWEV